LAEQFDVTIIGSGPGGYVAAVRAGQLGLKVAIIEKEKDARLGGTCGLRGCIPTKALLNAAHLYQKAGEFEHFGLKVKDLSYDWSGVQKYKSDVVAKNAAGVTYLMKKNKVAVYNGFGKIAGPRLVFVNGSFAAKLSRLPDSGFTQGIAATAKSCSPGCASPYVTTILRRCRPSSGS